MTSLQNLILGAVDYAGLFPPAGLPMETVVANYGTYLDSHEHAMLGRLIIPAMKLVEFENSAQGLLPTAEGKSPWQISALVPSIEQPSGTNHTQAFDAAVEAIVSFNERPRSQRAGQVVVDAIEVAAPTLEIMMETLERLPAGISSFLEVPHKSDPDGMVQCLAGSKKQGVFAKIRTGGVTPELIPSTGEVARFINACVRYDVGFKATAGLHHPIRGHYRLTYEENAPTGMMHGFLNVFFAAIIAFEHKISDEQIEEILSNTSPSRFVCSADKLVWDNLAVPTNRVAEIRDQFVISFGSCSFVEPTQELQLLPSDSFESVFAG